MFAKYLLLDDESDHSHLGQPWLRWKTVSRFKEVLDAFEKLDGNRHSILFVSENPPPGPGREEPFAVKALALAGGNDDQYLCEAYLENEYTPIRLCNANVPNPLEDVWLTRGQPETFPRYQIVSGELARRVLAEFVETGKLCDELTWVDEAARGSEPQSLETGEA